jgi:heme-binding NEAT domain protein
MHAILAKRNYNHNKHATTRTEENNRKTTEGDAGVRNGEPPKQTQGTTTKNKQPTMG